MQPLLGVVLAVGVLLGLPLEARADGKTEFEGTLRAGVATSPTGATLGGRFGVSYMHVYVGVPFDYDFGQSSETSFALGVEAGYGFVVGGAVTVRPAIGAGNLTDSTSVAGIGNVERFQTIYVEPDLTVLVAIGSGLFAGVDGGALFWAPRPNVCVASTSCTAGRWGTSVVGRLQAGMRF